VCADEKVRDTETRLNTVLGKVRAANKGMRPNDDASRAMELFATRGIQSSTVASLVSVKDVSWQGAIESFFGSNRYALVVDKGCEDEAVALVRRANPPLYATVIQPDHLKTTISKKVEPESVASLLDSDNEIALAYLRQILGAMRQVNTEVELREYSRALTEDGMLSANGGTRRIPRLPSDKWELGIRITKQDQERIAKEASEANIEMKMAVLEQKLLAEAGGKLSEALKIQSLEDFRHAHSTHQTEKNSLDAILSQVSMSLPEHLVILREQVEQARKTADEAGVQLRTLNGRLSAAQERLKSQGEKLTETTRQLNHLEGEYTEATADIDYDADRALELYETTHAMASKFDEVMALTELAKKNKRALDLTTNLPTAVLSDFIAYTDHDLNAGLIDERHDWRKAAAWVSMRMHHLKETTLTDYEAQANDARDAANVIFREDIAVKIRDALMGIQQEINDLNRILRLCPEFTNGERYRFVAEPSNAHKDLYGLIQGSARTGSGDFPSLFDSNEGVQKTLSTFLEACEIGRDKEDNPLEDYRLLLNFDLIIMVNGEEVDRLSKRIGVGSNGEHRVPFYVIAGASLANAYRILPGAKETGAAPMLIDEAFHGFDAQNTYVTAQFLRSLGLQLIMAAPDTDVGKIAPVVGSYYNLDRFGADVFVDEVIVKENARALLKSDMPALNPELVFHQIDLLGQTA
jgi:hypothetical protein